jgi:hypothetical protein
VSFPAFSVNTWSLDGVSFNTGPDGFGHSFLVKSTKGWKGSAPARPDQTLRPNANGAYRGPNYTAPRVVELDGVAQCSTRADRDALCDRLEGLCVDPDALYDLVRNEYSRSLKCRVERQSRIDVTELPDGVTVSFNIQVVASDPRKFSTTQQFAQTTLAQDPADGVLWNGPAPGTSGTEWQGPASDPNTGLVYQSTAGSPGIMVITNNGTASTPVRFTITTPPGQSMLMPQLIVAATGDTISYNGTMAAGSTLTVDTGTGLVLLNGATGSGQLARADFFEVPPKTTYIVQFTAGGPAPGAIASAVWSDAY